MTLITDFLSACGCQGAWDGKCTFAAIKLSGDQPLTIPSVVAGLAAILFLFFLYSSGRLLWCSFRYQRRFKHLIRCLDRERAGQAQIDRAALNRVGEVLGKDSLCRHGWREFTETLVVDSSGGADERIYNTRRSEELFPDDEIVAESMHPSFFRAVPGVLTSLGLLGTFLAILLGLAAIHVPDQKVVPGEGSGTVGQVPDAGPDPAGISGPTDPHFGAAGRIEGIGPFVNALSGKFASSVLALVFAILFTLMETRSLRRASQMYRRFCQAFDGLFPRRTAEELLTMMLTDVRQQRAAFEHFNTDLSARFRDGVSEGLGPTLERISDGLQGLVADRDSNIEALMEKLTGEFRSAMSQSAGVEFGQIATAMERASELIGRANQQQQETRDSFDRLIASLEESRSKQLQVSNQQAETMRSLLQQMVDTVGNASRASRSALDETIQELVERTRRESAEAAQALQEAMRSYGEQMNQQTTALLERVERVANRMENAGVEGSRELADSIQRVSASLEASAGTVAKQMQDAASGVVSQTGDWSQRVSRELETLLGEHRASVGAVAETREALERTVAVWRQGTEEMRKVLAPLHESTRQLESASSGFREVALGVERVQDRSVKIFDGARAEFERIEAMGGVSRDLLREHQRVFGEVQAGLGSALATIVEKLQALQDVSGRGLSSQLSEFDRHLATATRSLGAAIDDLAGVLDNAAERIRPNKD